MSEELVAQVENVRLRQDGIPCPQPGHEALDHREDIVVARHIVVNLKVTQEEDVASDMSNERFDNAVHRTNDIANRIIGGLVACKGTRIPVLESQMALEPKKLRHDVLHLLNLERVSKKFNAQFRSSEPALDDRALPGPDDEAKEDAREDQVGNVVAVDARNRSRAFDEANRRRRRRERSARSNDDNEGRQRKEARRARLVLKAKRLRNDRKGDPRNDLVDNGLGTVARCDRRVVRLERQDRKDQLRNDEAHDQKRKERLRTRRTANLLRELVRNLRGIGVGRIIDLGQGIIDGDLGVGRAGVGIDHRRNDLGTVRVALAHLL